MNDTRLRRFDDWVNHFVGCPTCLPASRLLAPLEETAGVCCGVGRALLEAYIYAWNADMLGVRQKYPRPQEQP